MNKQFIKLPHIVIEVLSYVMFIATIVMICVTAGKIEGEIATHFDLMGNPDGYSDPMTLIALPIILLLCNALLSAMLHFFPVADWNLPCKITENSASVVYNDCVWFMVVTIFWFSLFDFGIALFTLFLPKAMGLFTIIAIPFFVAETIFFICKMIIDNKKYR